MLGLSLSIETIAWFTNPAALVPPNGRLMWGSSQILWASGHLVWS